MTKKNDLVLTFTASNGTHKSLHPKFFKEHLDKATIQKTMDTMAKYAYLFTEPDEKTHTDILLYHRPYEAYYRITEKQPIE